MKLIAVTAIALDELEAVFNQPVNPNLTNANFVISPLYGVGNLNIVSITQSLDSSVTIIIHTDTQIPFMLYRVVTSGVRALTSSAIIETNSVDNIAVFDGFATDSVILDRMIDSLSPMLANKTKIEPTTGQEVETFTSKLFRVVSDELSRIEDEIGKTEADYFIGVQVDSEAVTRGRGHYDKLNNIGANEITRVAKEKSSKAIIKSDTSSVFFDGDVQLITQSIMGSLTVSLTPSSGYLEVDALSPSLINASRFMLGFPAPQAGDKRYIRFVNAEEATITATPYVLEVQLGPILKVLAVMVQTGPVMAMYDLSSYALKTNFYDVGNAYVDVKLTDTQFKLSPVLGVPPPQAGDKVFVVYSYNNSTRKIQENLNVTAVVGLPPARVTNTTLPIIGTPDPNLDPVFNEIEMEQSSASGGAFFINNVGLLSYSGISNATSTNTSLVIMKKEVDVLIRIDHDLTLTELSDGRFVCLNPFQREVSWSVVRTLSWGEYMVNYRNTQSTSAQTEIAIAQFDAGSPNDTLLAARLTAFPQVIYVSYLRLATYEEDIDYSVILGNANVYANNPLMTGAIALPSSDSSQISEGQIVNIAYQYEDVFVEGRDYNLFANVEECYERVGSSMFIDEDGKFNIKTQHSPIEEVNKVFSEGTGIDYTVNHVYDDRIIVNEPISVENVIEVVTFKDVTDVIELKDVAGALSLSHAMLLNEAKTTIGGTVYDSVSLQKVDKIAIRTAYLSGTDGFLLQFQNKLISEGETADRFTGIDTTSVLYPFTIDPYLLTDAYLQNQGLFEDVFNKNDCINITTFVGINEEPTCFYGTIDSSVSFEPTVCVHDTGAVCDVTGTAFSPIDGYNVDANLYKSHCKSQSCFKYTSVFHKEVPFIDGKTEFYRRVIGEDGIPLVDKNGQYIFTRREAPGAYSIDYINGVVHVAIDSWAPVVGLQSQIVARYTTAALQARHQNVLNVNYVQKQAISSSAGQNIQKTALNYLKVDHIDNDTIYLSDVCRFDNNIHCTNYPYPMSQFEQTYQGAFTPAGCVYDQTTGSYSSCVKMDGIIAADGASPVEADPDFIYRKSATSKVNSICLETSCRFYSASGKQKDFAGINGRGLYYQNCRNSLCPNYQPILLGNNEEILANYNYVVDNIVVDYVYGDNGIDWSPNLSALRQTAGRFGIDTAGETYYVSYKYGAREPALYSNFAYLLGTRELDESSRRWAKETYRKAISGVIAAYLKGPTLFGIEELVKTFTATTPEIKEGNTLGWRLDIDHLYSLPAIFTGTTFYSTSTPVTGQSDPFGKGLWMRDNNALTYDADVNFRISEGGLDLFVGTNWLRKNTSPVILDLYQNNSKGLRGEAIITDTSVSAVGLVYDPDSESAQISHQAIWENVIDAGAVVSWKSFSLGSAITNGKVNEFSAVDVDVWFLPWNEAEYGSEYCGIVGQADTESYATWYGENYGYPEIGPPYARISLETFTGTDGYLCPHLNMESCAQNTPPAYCLNKDSSVLYVTGENDENATITIEKLQKAVGRRVTIINGEQANRNYYVLDYVAEDTTIGNTTYHVYGLHLDGMSAMDYAENIEYIIHSSPIQSLSLSLPNSRHLRVRMQISVNPLSETGYGEYYNEYQGYGEYYGEVENLSTAKLGITDIVVTYNNPVCAVPSAKITTLFDVNHENSGPYSNRLSIFKDTENLLHFRLYEHVELNKTSMLKPMSSGISSVFISEEGCRSYYEVVLDLEKFDFDLMWSRRTRQYIAMSWKLNDGTQTCAQKDSEIHAFINGAEISTQPEDGQSLQDWIENRVSWVRRGILCPDGTLTETDIFNLSKNNGLVDVVREDSFIQRDRFNTITLCDSPKYDTTDISVWFNGWKEDTTAQWAQTTVTPENISYYGNRLMLEAVDLNKLWPCAFILNSYPSAGNIYGEPVSGVYTSQIYDSTMLGLEWTKLAIKASTSSLQRRGYIMRDTIGCGISLDGCTSEYCDYGYDAYGYDAYGSSALKSLFKIMYRTADYSDTLITEPWIELDLINNISSEDDGYVYSDSVYAYVLKCDWTVDYEATLSGVNGRYIQYRIEMLTNGKDSPVIFSVDFNSVKTLFSTDLNFNLSGQELTMSLI